MALPRTVQPDDVSAEPQIPSRPATIARELRGVFGATMTAQIAGTADVDAVAEWVSGASVPTADMACRLESAWEIARVLLEIEPPTVVRAWFGGQNRMLDGRAPAVVLRTEPDAVGRAARAFRAYG